MRRRQFLGQTAYAGLALGMVPQLVRAATSPCPPPRFSLQGGQSVSSSCGSSSTGFSTNFPLKENPISEGGIWHNTGLDWSSVQTTPGLAFGTQNNSQEYNDSYAYLAGFPANVQVTAIMHNSVPTSEYQESEILLRWSDAPHVARGYEMNLTNGGHGSIVRWNGAIGDFTVLPTTGPRDLNRDIVDGDVFTASVVGSTLTVKVNGNVIAQSVDSTFATGNPGIGFFSRLSASMNSRFGFKSISVQAL